MGESAIVMVTGFHEGGFVFDPPIVKPAGATWLSVEPVPNYLFRCAVVRWDAQPDAESA